MSDFSTNPKPANAGSARVLQQQQKQEATNADSLRRQLAQTFRRVPASVNAGGSNRSREWLESVKRAKKVVDDKKATSEMLHHALENMRSYEK
jgi:hypothetical protein